MQIEKVAENSPHRCKSSGRSGQCENRAVEGSEYCPLHGGNRALDKKRKEGIRNLRLTRWKAEIQEQGSSTEIFSLRDEIGVIRIILQETLNSCVSASELMQRSQVITELTGKVERLVSSCFSIEHKLSEFLTQEQLAEIADNILTVISRHITDENVLAQISEEILNEIRSSN